MRTNIWLRGERGGGKDGERKRGEMGIREKKKREGRELTTKKEKKKEKSVEKEKVHKKKRTASALEGWDVSFPFFPSFWTGTFLPFNKNNNNPWSIDQLSFIFGLPWRLCASFLLCSWIGGPASCMPRASPSRSSV